jgi:hypothetical protein
MIGRGVVKLTIAFWVFAQGRCLDCAASLGRHLCEAPHRSTRNLGLSRGYRQQSQILGLLTETGHMFSCEWSALAPPLLKGGQQPFVFGCG